MITLRREPLPQQEQPPQRQEHPCGHDGQRALALPPHRPHPELQQPSRQPSQPYAPQYPQR